MSSPVCCLFFDCLIFILVLFVYYIRFDQACSSHDCHPLTTVILHGSMCIHLTDWCVYSHQCSEVVMLSCVRFSSRLQTTLLNDASQFDTIYITLMESGMLARGLQWSYTACGCIMQYIQHVFNKRYIANWFQVVVFKKCVFLMNVVFIAGSYSQICCSFQLIK